MFKKLTTLRKVSLVVSIVFIILFFIQPYHDWYNILIGYLLCDSIRDICKFLNEWLVNDDAEEVTIDTNSESKN